ncbi:MAG: hypothetical protein JW820_04370, partial [Spirochaetales bacterium]|nr:hypothetical protein [Spirochaetales bacterium]
LALGERAAPAGTEQAEGPDSSETEPEGPGVGEPVGNYWTFHACAGTNIPLGSMSEALGVGIPALVSFGYTLERPWGALDFAALTGFQYQGTRQDVRYGYHLLAAPLGAEVRYTTRWASPWYVSGGAAGGAAFNFVVYKEAYPFRGNLLNISAFAAPSVGGGYRLSDRLSLELNAYVWMVFFTDAVYFGLTPTFGVQLAF